MKPDTNWMTLKELAEVMEISPSTASKALKQTPTTAPFAWGIRLNKRVKFPRYRVEEWIRNLKRQQWDRGGRI